MAQLNLFGPRDFLLQLEEELEVFVRSRRKELVLPPLARRYQELLNSSVRRFNLSVEALPSLEGWSHTRWKVVNSEEPPRLPKLSLAEFLRLQRRLVAPPGAFSSGEAKAALSEEEILQRLRLRLWAALLCCTAAERAVQADTLMAPAVEPVEPAEPDSDRKVAPVLAKEEAVKEEAPAESAEPSAEHPAPSSLVKVERTTSDVGQEIKLERTTSDVDREALKGEHPENHSHGLQELVLNQPKEEKSEVPAKAEQEAFAGIKAETGAPEPRSEPPELEPWVKVRQEPDEPEHQETPGLVRCGSATLLKEEPDALEAKLEPQNEDIMSPEEQDLREALRAAFERLKVAAGRWTEPDAKEEDDIAPTTVHCFRRFSPSHAPGRLYLRDSATAPWPSVKLQRDSEHVIWRPEWMLPHFQGPGTWEEGASMGGIFSWALEPNSVSFGEGFEVNLRDEPGPCETGTKLEEDIPERLPNDFLLSFRRGYAAWHFTAGTRGRSGAQKMVPDTLFGSKAGQRQMFWAACLECHDGKHYVLVGTVPGMLSEHFFVAKVARPRPLTHLGFSYLPTPKATVWNGSGVDPLWIESITIYPHGLSGELPFISHRFLQVVKEETVEEAGDTVAEIALEADAEAAEEQADVVSSAAPRLVLLSKKAPGGEAESRARLEEWCTDARRELGLPSLEVKPRSPSTRKRRRTNRPVGSNAESALTSWGPSSVSDVARVDRVGPYEDSLRHLGVKRQPRPGNYRC